MQLPLRQDPNIYTTFTFLKVSKSLQTLFQMHTKLNLYKHKTTYFWPVVGASVAHPEMHAMP